MENKKLISPIRWVGGKKKVLKYIKELLPKKFNTYYEPFVGGGALFFDIQPNKAVINDTNFEVMTLYKCIKDYPNELMALLDDFKEKHGKEFFHDLREIDRTHTLSNFGVVDISARFVYLNKAGFNGLYRVNKKGQFNAPFGTPECSELYKKENIINISNYLKNSQVSILNEDFEEAVKGIKEGDFVYFDPPYDYLDKGFVRYSVEYFLKQDQIRLANLCKDLDRRGIKWMLSNHNTPLINELFKDFDIKIVNISRTIAARVGSRAKVEEVLIRNYSD